MSNVSSVTNHFPTANEGFITTLGSTILSGATTVPLTSASGLTNGTVFVGIIEPGTVGKEQTFTGTVDTAGVQITGVKWTRGSNTDHTAGVTIVDYVTGTGNNMFTKGLLVEHKQSGAHAAVTADSLVVTGNVTAANFIQTGGASADGWTVGLPSVSSVSANGNRSYDITFSSTVASTLSPGMRLRTTRTVAAPNTSFSLDGSNDYYVKTSPNKLTFTDDFVVSAWVYMTAYPGGTETAILSRYNGTSGFWFGVTSTGQLVLSGHSGATINYRRVISYDALPLNQWVHVAAELDMSTYTVGPTSCYIMVDGIDAPSYLATSGTNPTSLTQAGNLEIGSLNGGSSPFPGYIDQAAIYSAKVTQATIRASMNQKLSGTETSLASAYSNGSTSDLNTTTPNNLTATNGATTATRSPFGNDAVSTTLDYGVVQKVATTVATVQVPSGCTIPTSGGVSATSYSTMATPYGYPFDKTKWMIKTIFPNEITANSATPTSANSKITLPVGVWEINFASIIRFDYGSTGFETGKYYWSTSGTTETDGDLVLHSMSTSSAASTMRHGTMTKCTAYKNLSTATTYTLIGVTSTASASIIISAAAARVNGIYAMPLGV